MSDRVELRPSGLAVIDWDGDSRSYVERDPPHDPIVHLRSECTIAEGTTLGDILRWLHSESELEHFFARYSWCQAIEAFYFEAEGPPPEADDGMPLDYLEISWDATHYLGGDGHLSLSTDFIGIGPMSESSRNAGFTGGTERYSVSYCPVNTIADVPVRLNPKLELMKIHRGGSELGLVSSRGFSLLDVLDAILWDISFVGGPEEKVAFLEDAKERVDEARQSLKDEVAD